MTLFHVPGAPPARKDLDPNLVLRGCADKLKKVVVLGYDELGREFMATNMVDAFEINWLCDRMKLTMLAVVDDVQNGAR
jgi:hypothetical protein